MKTKLWFLLSVMLIVTSSTFASQLTNSVDITTNLVFRLKITGTGRLQSQFKSDQLIDYLLAGTRTNLISLRKFPYGNFDFHLFDESGNEVPKTKLGQDLTRTPPKLTRDGLLFWRKSRFFPFFVGGWVVNHGPLFRPDNVFLITNKGVYELEVRARLCVIMTNGVPDEKAMADGLNSTGRGLQFLNDFGVLTSPPLRVKVIKE